MVFAIAIDSDVRVNTNRWHFSGMERELDAAIAPTNTVCVKTPTFRLPQLAIFVSLLSPCYLMGEIRI